MTNFTKEQEQRVWEAADVIANKNPDKYRKDPYGNTIMREKYGCETPMGWEIDHIIPEKFLKIDELSNLQAMQSAKNAGIKNSLDKKTRYGVTARQLLKTILSKLNS